MKYLLVLISLSICLSCKNDAKANQIDVNQSTETPTETIPEPDFTITTSEKTHNKFSSKIPPVLIVTDGSIIEAFTQEATGGQLNINSTIEDLKRVDMDKVHTLTGPIYVEGAEEGDVLAVDLLDLEPGDWGWTAMEPEFGFLTGEHESELFKTYELDKANNLVHFSENVSIPLKPFPGVMGVAPKTEDMLTTFPPRENGGNMDDPHMIKGVTVYFPVFVKGALFSIGDTHAVQGLGEVVGTAVECDMRVRFRLRVIKNRTIPEPQYESEDYYATTGFATTVDEAAKKATRYMIDHISETYNMPWDEAYMLCSLVGDLKIAEVVDEPNMLVTMHIPKHIFKNKP
ncbi:acetamidase/formamidase family protein [Winogradskyella aurantia]|uniref:Acetamidase n=1 Tax=Winogradskyella aurantia TaxID=1915063 RepID=A0A265US78_9FLAO|nr:acetamidase/formamidase family protein [Winogradskyella aurantia]OZV68150.1 acetamidase [Winogradskyella aurantia]